MDELDALLGDLGKDVVRAGGGGGASGGHASARINPAGRGQVLLRNNAATASQPAGRPASGLEDLDSLITQLGGAAAAQGQRKTASVAAAAPAPVANAHARPKPDVSDIDALMASLSMPSGGGGGSASGGRPSVPTGRASGGGGDDGGLLSDLDAIMASLGDPVGGASSARSSSAYPQSGGASRPVSVAPGVSSPAGARVSTALGAPGGRQSQDLDALLNSLQVDSRTTPVAYQPSPPVQAHQHPHQHQHQHHQHHQHQHQHQHQHAPAAGAAPAMRPPGSGGIAPSVRPMGGAAPAASTPKGTCATCQRPIQGPMMQALGGTYHPNCFICGNCGESLGSGSFFQTDGRPTCSRCYQAQFCARCAHCSQAIQGQCISALNKQWHVNCFICAQCLKPFGTAPYFEREGNPFCESCLYGIFSSRCGACDQPIKADTVNACGKQFHPECFVCAHCRRAFAGQPYFEHGGRPYCQLHYHSQIGATCGCGCGRSIMGRVVQALGKQWLPEHFLCGFCMNSLAGQNFTQRDNKAYCNGCFGKLFAA